VRVVEDPSGPIHGVDRSAVTIGAYDGVHLGHRAVLHAVCTEAERLDGSAAVVTFDRHPAQVVRPESAPRLLCDLDQKLELLADAGVDLTVVLTFDQARASESAEDFVRTVLVEALSARSVIVGEDFHFGHRRQGNVALLEEMGGELGFGVRGHHLVGPDGRDARDELQVSSTAIRRALVEGRLDDANSMLGREHEMRGKVVEGDRRGREIGFPTANVAIPDWMLVPADGIYAGWMVERSGRRRTVPAAIYIGHRPTFYDDSAATVLEVHGLADVGDIYGEDVAVRFSHRLRGDQRFESVEELSAQLRTDCEDARRLLA
jgi:riboflavin kinase/FMN adenylyltransferase